MSEVRETVRAALAEVLGEQPAGDQVNLQDQGLTSVESISLVMLIEERLGVVFPDGLLALDNFTDVDRIVAVLTPLLTGTNR